MQQLCDQRYTESEQQLINRKARKMAGKQGYRASDVEDLEQELALHVFPRTHRFRPGPAPREWWVNGIAQKKLCNLIAAKKALKRDNQDDVSVEVVRAGKLMDATHTPEQIALRMDLQEVLARMPEDLRSVAVLRQENNERQLEKLLGLTRGQVRHRLVQIERILREAGFA